ncbi:hypothetical protein ACA910_014331 [Epithemia clementina (nom. ined.)]
MNSDLERAGTCADADAEVLKRYHDDDDDDDDPLALWQQQQHDDSCKTYLMTKGNHGGDMNSLSSFKVHWATTRLIMVLILALSLGTCLSFIAVGVSRANDREDDDFHRDAQDFVQKIQASWAEYVHAASLVHARCRDGTLTRAEFRALYEYLVAGGLDFKAVQFDPHVPHSQRQELEDEARAYYAEHYPHVDYQGILGFEPGLAELSPRSEQPFYYPIHYMEPIVGNEAAIELDYYSSESRIQTVNAALTRGLPAVTSRLQLVKTSEAINRCTSEDVDAYGVVLMHPGVNLTAQPDVWPRDLASFVICVPQLLFKATEKQVKSLAAYIHDSSSADPAKMMHEPDFMGAVRVDVDNSGNVKHTYYDEVSLSSLDGKNMFHRQAIPVANRYWTITVVPVDETYRPHLVFVILGGTIIFVAGVCLALWVYANTVRMRKFNDMKVKAEAEKAQLILKNARQATRAERELNDFIAHEVRNPVAAAMAATSFVKAAIQKDAPLVDENARQQAREDMCVIDNALKFVNDLLRNMLDMHRAADKQLKVNKQLTDVLHDVLEPVHAMLHQRGDRVELLIECTPPNLYVMTDSLRLKQVILNLGRNSAKFVNEGFIRLCAEVVDGQVQLSVEDSGPGIPQKKREFLFAKFQESLDRLSQGTGIGLFLCKNLVELMGGEICLDDDYDSGVPNQPGTRFLVKLKVPPVEPPADEPAMMVFHDDVEQYTGDEMVVGDGGVDSSQEGMEKKWSESTDETCPTGSSELAAASPRSNGVHNMTSSIPKTLPKNLSVLLVDDDSMIRKMFSRAIETVAPTWTFRQAANGETALRITETEQFDLIFMDMYMASVEKQLLGTETVAEMRVRGVKSRICGLSANDKEIEFLNVGADAFAFKPFPCAHAALMAELLRVLYS